MKLLKNLIIASGFFAITSISSMQKNNAAQIQTQAIVNALKQNDQKKVVELLEKGPAEKLILVLNNALRGGSLENLKVILDTNIEIQGGNILTALTTNNNSIIQLFLSYLTKQKLLYYANSISKQVPQNMKDFIIWLQNGSSLQNLSPETIKTFARIAFKMRNFNDEFSQLLLMLKPEDLHEVFTQTVIHDALMSHNLKGFELLLPVIAKDRGLVNIIRDELYDVDDQVFVEKIRTLIKNETGKPSTGKGDIAFHF